MIKNFTIGQSNELVRDGQIYDLHNLFDFVGFHFLSKDGKFRLLFEPNLEHEENQTSISVNFQEIDYLELSPKFGSKVTDLDEIGYKIPDDRNDEWLMTEEQADSNDHLFFRFSNHDYVRIHAAKATLLEVVKLVSASDRFEAGNTTV